MQVSWPFPLSGESFSKRRCGKWGGEITAKAEKLFRASPLKVNCLIKP